MEPRRSPGFPAGAFVVLRETIPALRSLTRWWAGLEVVGNRLAQGPAVVAANHLSHVDPIVVSLVVDRPVRYLALDELFGQYPAFDTVTLWLGAIPMTRTGVPLSAMRTAIAELHAGGTVGLFPEGRRVAAWGDEPPRRGAAWLSYRTGAPLIPVALHGTGDVMPLEEMKLHRHPVQGHICEPILPDAYEGVSDPVGAMTREWARRIGEALRT